MIQLDHFVLPLTYNTLTLADVQTKIELEAEAKGNDEKLRQESEGGCSEGFRSKS
jgi:hypothetical protein